MKKLFVIIILLNVAWTVLAGSQSQDVVSGNEAMTLIAGYARNLRFLQKDTVCTNMYVSYDIDISKRNFALLAVPSMYSVVRGERKFAGESFYTLKLLGGKVLNIDMLQRISTVPHRENIVSLVKNFAMPDIYGEMIYGSYILSPCNIGNKRLYKYFTSELSDDRLEVAFVPKVKNTQLINGKAIIERSSGRVILMEYSGEMDMITFHTKIDMSDSCGMVPKCSETDIRFKFLGNDITGSYKAFYNLDSPCINHAQEIGSGVFFDKVRPVPLDEEHIGIYRQYAQNEGKSTVRKKTKLNKFGDYFLDRTSGKFGARSRGSYHVSPIVNPQYLGYSSSKGVTYRMKLNGSYSFSGRCAIDMTANLGYSFKQNQLYINIPLKFTLNKVLRVETEFGTGNRITSSEVLNKVKDEKYDSVHWENMRLDYFKDMYWKLQASIDLGGNLSVRPGMIFHRRAAVDETGFILSGEPSEYRSFAPTLQLQYYPSFLGGSVFTLDYERGVKGVLKSDMRYERIEGDFSWKQKLVGMRLLSLRAGGGFYTSRSDKSYFLDYSNFRYEYVPGGWDDDWTGDFQLLNSNWYNASKFYVRGNLTYECPMLLLSKLPVVGRYLETERVYANMLLTQYLRPYMEYGYGFTNKYFSAGVFCGVAQKKFEGVGIRFDVELFKDW